MNSLHRRLRIALPLVVAVNAGIALSGMPAESRSIGEAAPANYRALIARYMLTLGLDEQVLRTAMIATPFDKPDGIWGGLAGNTRPVVCVSIVAKNKLGQEGKWYSLFSFENGQPYRWPPASGVLVSECGTFSSFHEVMKNSAR